MKYTEKELWERCVDFHGHQCPGLTIGYKAALFAVHYLDLNFSGDEEIVCIAENDACGIDAIQVILGCSAGKGNLLFHIRGKSAYTFYDRKSGKNVRIILKDFGKMERKEYFDFLHSKTPEELFEIKETKIRLPEKAKIFDSYRCEKCGEITGSNWVRVRDGKYYCLDCYEAYDRFNV